MDIIATPQELITLKEISKSIASQIIEGKQYATIEDLLSAKAFGAKMFEEIEGAIRFKTVEGVPIFKASTSFHRRREELLAKNQNAKLTKAEEEELDLYEEIDDYLSLINRTLRNLTQRQSKILHDATAKNTGGDTE